MDKLINTILEEESLTGLNIDKITKGKAKVILYEDLRKFNDIIKVFGKYNNLIVLFPTEKSNYNGHWIAILKNGKKLNHWDSYSLSPAAELQYSSNQTVEQNILSKLYQKAIQDGYSFEYNRYRLQKMTDSIATCGKWSSIRILFDYLNNEQFANLFLKQKMKPDQLVCLLTMITLDDEYVNKKVIERLT